jgi:AraC-like DNA-binding protein
MDSHALRFADVLVTHGVAEQTAFLANRAHIDHADWLVRRLDYVELFLVVGGSGRQVVRTPSGIERRLLAPGDVFLFRPSDETALQVADPDGISILIVMVPRAEWDAFTAFVGVDPSWNADGAPPMARIDPADAERLRPFEEAVRGSRQSPTRLELLRLLVEVIPLLFPASGRRPRAASAPSWLSDSLERMREEANLRGGVPRFATLAHVTPQHLAASVRRYFDTTPTAIIADLRLRHAAGLLATTPLAVGEIARRCGFATLSHFSNSFRAVHHVSPREYRGLTRRSA